MNNDNSSAGAGPGGMSAAGALPDHPDLARFVATLFQRLGGTLAIDAGGTRRLLRPSRQTIAAEGVPQIAEAGANERFTSIAEWEGAVKLTEFWLGRLSPADRDFVFGAMGEVPESGLGAWPAGFDFRRLM